jgi:hypothetical protein
LSFIYPNFYLHANDDEKKILYKRETKSVSTEKLKEKSKVPLINKASGPDGKPNFDNKSSWKYGLAKIVGLALLQAVLTGGFSEILYLIKSKELKKREQLSDCIEIHNAIKDNLRYISTLRISSYLKRKMEKNYIHAYSKFMNMYIQYLEEFGHPQIPSHIPFN